jgi:DNA invertase Pin-like site-specific DNA recombinase
VSVIDEDLGKSGASSAKRTGFQRLGTEVGLGRIGAALSIEVSRPPRNNRNWYHLLDLGGSVDTIIVDDEGIYDVRQPNDHLLLGLKGTLSEAELSCFRQRAQAGLQAKARAVNSFSGCRASVQKKSHRSRRVIYEAPRGSRTTKVVPASSDEVTAIAPLCAETISLTMKSPSPRFAGS